MESKRATKETGARIYCIATATKATTHEMPISNFVKRLTHTGRPVSFLCLLRQVSSALSRNRGNQARPDVHKAQFVTANLMAAELHGLSARVSLSAT
jgi:hypothetical protein